MFTSLAPSPIARVTLEGKRFLIILTISAFCLGETLHARTTSTLSEADKKLLNRLGLASILVRVSPATIIACFYSELDGFSIYFMTSEILNSISPLSVCSITCCPIELSKRPADTPIFMAVSILSPVSTHTLIPVFFMNWIVSATSSYSLSSMAVDPTNSISTSISSSTAATLSSLPSIASLASYAFLNHGSNSCGETSLSARNRVLRPS